MDTRRGAFSSFVFWWVFFVVASLDRRRTVRGEAGICEIKGCKCVEKVGGWMVVNCTFAANQDVVFESNSIHQNLLEIFINGGNSIVLERKSFNSLQGLSILYIGNANKIIIKKQAFYNSSSPSLRVDVENCDSLVVESEAFVNSDSTVIVEVNKAKFCIVYAAAFSKLLNATFQNIKKLDVVERSFEITKKDGIVRHGPLTKITFNRVVVSKIPKGTFFSSLAEIRIQDSQIDEIHSNAFSATQINSIFLINSTIGSVKSEACPTKSLIGDLKISRCKISTLESKAVTCAISNFSIRNSRIHVIETGAINTTSANIDLVGNDFVNFESSAMGFSSWNKILVEQNIIKNFGSNAIYVYGEQTSQIKTEFSFINNEVINLENDSMTFVSSLEDDSLVFDENSFEIKCNCFLNMWFTNMMRTNRSLDSILNSSFCRVDELLARCYELKTGLINMNNFTEMVCAPGKIIKCEPYLGEEKVVNITDPIFLDAPKNNHSWLVLTLTIVGLIIIAIIATFIFLVISGGRWLSRKGYFRNMHYSPNETTNDEENTIVTVDQDSEEQKQELPEELTLEYLEYLKKRLDDPSTHQETSDMIERLYEMFIIEDNYDNNNKQDEEAHLYEELANMQTQPQERKSVDSVQNGPLSILRMMEERFNLQFIDTEDERVKNSTMINDYSEPSDAAVHLYSELKQNQAQNEQMDKKGTLGSGMMTSRPLPTKPNDMAGPSKLN